MNIWKSAALAVTLIGVGVVPAQAQKENRLPVTHETASQKAAYIDNLVSRSAAARKVEASSNAEAKAELAKAKELAAQAKTLIGAGKDVEGDKMINEALALVQSAAHRLEDPNAAKDRLMKAYNIRKDSTNALLEAFERVAQEKGVAKDAMEKQARVEKLMATADDQVKAGKVSEAKDTLDKAYRLATQITRDLRDGDTLVRELKFETAEDEYLYEIDRNDSHFYLLDLTIKEKDPHPKFKVKIDELKEQAQTLRDKAEGMAKAGEFDPAIDTLGESTKLLIQAIRTGGNFIPG